MTKQHPFRRALLRGLGVAMPPLLTIVLFLWAWSTIEAYVLQPTEAWIRNGIVLYIKDVRDTVSPEEAAQYVQLPNGGPWVSRLHYEDFKDVKKELDETPSKADEFYELYVQRRFLPRMLVLPIFLCGFILILYLLGEFLAAGVGRILWNTIEGIIQRLPVIRNVYSSVKQVTDFVFTEREIEFNRVVAVEYPRKGIWSIGFVTGESLLDIRAAANEPVLSVLMPTSPMPATGFTVTVRKSETIDLDLTIDQAIQFIVSCGVVIPPQQQQDEATILKVSATTSNRIGVASNQGPESQGPESQGPESQGPESQGPESQGPEVNGSRNASGAVADTGDVAAAVARRGESPNGKPRTPANGDGQDEGSTRDAREEPRAREPTGGSGGEHAGPEK